MMDQAQALERRLEQVRIARRLPSPAARQQIRKRAELTQSDVAQELGVTREAVALWERGQRTPRLATAVAYVELLDRLSRESLSS